MPKVVHFEVPADEPERAVAFYERVFDWKVQKRDWPQSYWLIRISEDEEAMGGGLMKREPPFTGMVNVFDVASLDEFCEKVTAHGGKVVIPKMAVQKVGYVAYCTDTENNLFGLLQPDETAQ